MNNNNKKWEEFLNPEVLRTKLITASMYLTAFELLKDSVIDRVKGFYITGFDENGTETSSAYIAGDLEGAFLERFPPLISLLRKIEVWWIVNFEIPINSDFDNAEIDESGIVPGVVMTIQLMFEIALGEPEKAAYYLNEFKKRHKDT